MTHSIDVRTVAMQQSVGTVVLDNDGKLQFPRLEEIPGIYCFTFTRASGRVTKYVGESDRLRRRLQHYRTPGPSQPTNLRINQLMKEVLAEGGAVGVSVVERATVNIGDSHHALDLAEKFSRVLVESAWILQVKSTGLQVENA
jgi:hypothetical protein